MNRARPTSSSSSLLWMAAAGAAVVGVLLLQSPTTQPPTGPSGATATTAPAATGSAAVPSHVDGSAHAHEPEALGSPPVTEPQPATSLSGPPPTAEPLPAPPWQPTARGFASAFTQPGSSQDDWLARVTPWTSTYLTGQYQLADHRRLPTAMLLELTATATGETSVEFLATYDTGLKLLCRAELEPSGWKIIAAEPVR